MTRHWPSKSLPPGPPLLPFLTGRPSTSLEVKGCDELAPLASPHSLSRGIWMFQRCSIDKCCRHVPDEPQNRRGVKGGRLLWPCCLPFEIISPCYGNGVEVSPSCLFITSPVSLPSYSAMDTLCMPLYSTCHHSFPNQPHDRRGLRLGVVVDAALCHRALHLIVMALGSSLLSLTSTYNNEWIPSQDLFLRIDSDDSVLSIRILFIAPSLLGPNCGTTL